MKHFNLSVFVIELNQIILCVCSFFISVSHVDPACYLFQEGRTIVENKTADIIQETRKLNIRRKGSGLNPQGEASHKFAHRNFLQNPLDHETQLKASRDVRWQISVTRYVVSVLHFAFLFFGKFCNCLIYCNRMSSVFRLSAFKNTSVRWRKRFNKMKKKQHFFPIFL
jgi:hypothetical protein